VEGLPNGLVLSPHPVRSWTWSPTPASESAMPPGPSPATDPGVKWPNYPEPPNKPPGHAGADRPADGRSARNPGCCALRARFRRCVVRASGANYQGQAVCCASVTGLCRITRAPTASADRGWHRCRPAPWERVGPALANRRRRDRQQRASRLTLRRARAASYQGRRRSFAGTTGEDLTRADTAAHLISASTVFLSAPG
jgi:hypothetical protein